MNVKDLVWSNKDCCAMHKQANVAVDQGTLQIDVFEEGVYSVAAFNEYGGNIKHPLLDDVVVILSEEDLNKILKNL
jgi:hypothetical protein